MPQRVLPTEQGAVSVQILWRHEHSSIFMIKIYLQQVSLANNYLCMIKTALVHISGWLWPIHVYTHIGEDTPGQNHALQLPGLFSLRCRRRWELWRASNCIIYIRSDHHLTVFDQCGLSNDRLNIHLVLCSSGSNLCSKCPKVHLYSVVSTQLQSNEWW